MQETQTSTTMDEKKKEMKSKQNKTKQKTNRIYKIHVNEKTHAMIGY